MRQASIGRVGRVASRVKDRRVGVTAFKSIEGENEAHRAQRRRNHSMFIPGEYYSHGKTERDYFKENLRYYMSELREKEDEA